MTKFCPNCERTLPVGQFSPRSGERRSELRAHCKECSCAAAKRWGRANPERVKARNDRRPKQVLTPEQRARKNARHRQWVAKNYEYNRRRIAEAGLQRRYGMGSDELKALLAAQGGVCAICERAVTWENRHVDHIDTPTGPIVRGVLCSRCNNGLGMFGDQDYERIRKAADYVARYASRAVAL